VLPKKGTRALKGKGPVTKEIGQKKKEGTIHDRPIPSKKGGYRKNPLNPGVRLHKEKARKEKPGPVIKNQKKKGTTEKKAAWGVRHARKAKSLRGESPNNHRARSGGKVSGRSGKRKPHSKNATKCPSPPKVKNLWKRNSRGQKFDF